MTGGYGVVNTIRCICGKEAHVVVCGVGAYVWCPVCGAGTYMCNNKEDAIKMFEENYNLDAKSTEVLAFAKYPDLEKAADRTAAKIKEGFMEMGYILKVARDTDILAGSGYASHEEFAEKRYGLNKGTVSRYIRIVERFSVGGNSHVLQEGYKNIGFAKLSLMLHMPDAIAEEITESYSKQEVQAIKEEIDAERAISDIEFAIEAAGIPEEEKTGSLLDQAIRQLGRERPALYCRLHEIYTLGGIAAGNMVMETLAPQGDATYMVRIAGTGRLMLAFSGSSVSVTNVRSCDKERYTAEDVLAAVTSIMHAGSLVDSWQQEYEEPMDPEAVEDPKANEQEEKNAGKQKEKRKESKVVKAAPPKEPAKKESGRTAGPERAVVEEIPPEEQLPGQIEITDYPEAIPDVHYEEIPEEVSGERREAPEKEVESFGSRAVDEIALAMVRKVEREDDQTCEKEEADVDAALRTDELWMDARRSLESLRKYFAIWDNKAMPMEYLEKVYQDAISLAADIERLMNIKEEDQDGEEYHAQQG